MSLSMKGSSLPCETVRIERYRAQSAGPRLPPCPRGCAQGGRRCTPTAHRTDGPRRPPGAVPRPVARRAARDPRPHRPSNRATISISARWPGAARARHAGLDGLALPLGRPNSRARTWRPPAWAGSRGCDRGHHGQSVSLRRGRVLGSPRTTRSAASWASRSMSTCTLDRERSGKRLAGGRRPSAGEAGAAGVLPAEAAAIGLRAIIRPVAACAPPRALSATIGTSARPGVCPDGLSHATSQSPFEGPAPPCSRGSRRSARASAPGPLSGGLLVNGNGELSHP